MHLLLLRRPYAARWFLSNLFAELDWWDRQVRAAAAPRSLPTGAGGQTETAARRLHLRRCAVRMFIQGAEGLDLLLAQLPALALTPR